MCVSFVSPHASRLFSPPLRSFRSAFLKPSFHPARARAVVAATSTFSVRHLPFATAVAPTEPASKSQPALPRTKLNAVTAQLVGNTLCVKGWVRSVRAQKAFAFIDLNDGTNLSGLQIVVDGHAPCFPLVSSLSTGCSISAVGELVASLGSAQPVELRASTLKLIGTAADYPLQKKRHSLEFLRSIAHLRPRTNSIAAVSRIRSALAVATHSFFDELGFVYVHAPLITASDCEGAGEMFRVTTALNPDGTPNTHVDASEGDAATKVPRVQFQNDFFGKPAFLTVSGQLSAECFATALGDVYTFGPTFRAENSNTSRHLAEFWMIEPEMAFADLKDDMDNAERLVKYLVSYILQKCDQDLAFFDRFVEKGLLRKLNTVADEDFARISYTEAIEILDKVNKPNKKGKRRFEFEVRWGIDLQSEHERYLAEQHFQKPVFVYNYPSAIKAFYMRANDEDDGKTCAAMDLLVPGIGELVGGSQREERLDVLEEKIERNGLEKEAYWWYLDLRRFGSVPHAGYGLGFERLVQFVTGMDNIRDVIPFPRYPGNAEF
ncbi:unnamed protein product [Agarophyton chilense]